VSSRVSIILPRTQVEDKRNSLPHKDLRHTLAYGYSLPVSKYACGNTSLTCGLLRKTLL